jgi:endoglucanase
MGQGFNIFRVPFAMERMARGSVEAPLDQAYLTNYSVAINYITDNGGHVAIDPHNYGRYNGAIITDTTAFETFWSNLATAFKSNPLVVRRLPYSTGLRKKQNVLTCGLDIRHQQRIPRYGRESRA